MIKQKLLKKELNAINLIKKKSNNNQKKFKYNCKLKLKLPKSNTKDWLKVLDNKYQNYSKILLIKKK